MVEIGKSTNMKNAFKCEYCNKELNMNSILEIVQNSYQGYTIHNRRKIFCNKQCYDSYCDKYLVEIYNGVRIYKIELNGETKYIPYMGCQYCFSTLENCKKRIDNKNISIQP